MVILLGGSGYIGRAFEAELLRRGWPYQSISRSEIDYSSFTNALELLRRLKPSFLINAAGFTGRPNVDACEARRAETLQGNTLLPATLAHACSVASVPWGHVSSGCIYAGDNDVETNHTPEQIAGDFTAFERKVHAALPVTEIIFISIKPSTRRWPWIEQIKGANALVRQYCAAHPHLTFMDIVPPMLGADGTPRNELLLDDGLHMTPAGYKIWNDTLRPLLQVTHSNR